MTDAFGYTYIYNELKKLNTNIERLILLEEDRNKLLKETFVWGWYNRGNSDFDDYKKQRDWIKNNLLLP